MKTFISLLVFCFSLPLVAQNLTERNPVSIPSEPTTVEEFKSLQSKLASTPEGGAAMLVLAISIYGKNPELGTKAVVLSVLSKNRQKSTKPSAVDGMDLGNGDKYLLGQLDKYKMLSNGYWKGAEPANGYTPSSPLTVETFTNPYSGEESAGKLKLFVATRGASSFRPVSLEKDADGLWRAKEMSSLFVGMMPPK
ncbi:hypothetical protein ND861_09030 [Leptospira sp. 2 VSF19]|uniref:DUF6935 domain-containing protein n=1 Tax=Leptospira soteropolitanensis TaxID=2950025 RepID=A0AAW5VG92_9LEPT|nr:hypothetical protein [Leptospira soteropolitanensis]MCW7492654.1 hypothetical protein [Leptospira soteropolitanensis]MCW7500337.1 hypothetical protein [Leptospira soteropolitanensis]MCW7522628.1 hypothetical protein [Leptospira soteropolitanensis]MCW7526484.1 hypothetical protein [Leptospira soteropolitanensis]MCW7530307.1 hypothetical protein [Leptospira soteropolitanensis]